MPPFFFQLSDEEKDSIPDDVKKAAREMGKTAFLERLKEINMSEYDAKMYNTFSQAVRAEVKELRTMLAGLHAKGDEREWLKHQTEGDMDDSKLVDGLTGEQAIYKRRGTKNPDAFGLQQHPKRLRFLVDVSGSMYRFNGHDLRLQRMMEVACLVMEAFHGMTGVEYEIIGHSGESASIPLVTAVKGMPKHEHDRLKVLQEMHAHAQFCISGDNTLEAVQAAISKVIFIYFYLYVSHL